MKKRLISMLCASAIAFLLALPSYAFDSDMATSAKVNADIAELKETYSIDSNLMQDVISNYPDAEPQIAALKQQAEAYQFTPEQVEMHLQGMKNYAEDPAEVEYGKLSEDGTFYILPNGDTMPNRFSNALNLNSGNDTAFTNQDIAPLSFSSNYISQTNADDQTGVFWVVKSTTGHDQATAFFNLPTVTASASSPDRPYMFFSVNTTSSSICGDYGIVYYPASQRWALCTHAIKWNTSTGSYDTVPWQEITLPSSYNSGGLLYLHLQITNTNGTDKVTITVKDGSTFAVLATLSCDFTGNPFNSSLSNVNIFREITLAQHLDSSGKLNTSTGTRTENSKFSNAYLYTPSTYSSWGTARTTTAYKQAPKSSQLATVVVNAYTKWNSEDISIRFTQ